MVGTTVSHYKILSKLGEGGMGIVYKAHDTTLDRDVALKFLPLGLHAHESERARFLQEARAAATLNHSHICTIHEIGEAQDQPFIVMEYVEGETLREKIEAGGLKYAGAITYAVQIGEALQEAHTHGVVHRDVKSDNIMVTAKGEVKVMDFGLAKLKGSLHLTKTSSTVGTLAYMAPEQIECKEVDGRSDIFSFGIVLYEMLTGYLPFRGEHEAAVMYSIVNEEPLPLQSYLPEAPSELVHILDRALAKDPEERYQTVQEMLIDLKRLKKDTAHMKRPSRETPWPVQGRVSTSLGAPKKPTRKWLWLGVLGGLLLCAVAIFALFFREREVRLNPHRTSTALALPFRNIERPTLSGDGKWLAFSARAEDGTYDIYMMNTAPGSTPRRVSEQREPCIGECDISPDLSRIAYDLFDMWLGRFQIRLVASEGGQVRTLADTGLIARWTPDGSRIGYLRRGRSSWAPSASGKLEVWSVRPDGSGRRLELLDTTDVLSFHWSYSWSPDGKSITWVRNYPEGYREVMVRELATGREEQLTHDKAKVDEVIWAANNQIIFISNKSGQSNLWIIPAHGGEAVQITQGTAPIIGARISTDGKKILYLQKELIKQLWTSAVDGSRPRQVTTDEVNVLWTDLSPDGQSIAAIIGDVDQFKPDRSLSVMDGQGRNRRVLASGAELSWPRWSPDGKWLAYTDSGKVYLIQPLNPGTPRLLCEGSPICWMSNEDLSIWRGMKSYRYSLQQGLVGQLAGDSVRVLALKGSNRILYLDFRQGRGGLWSGSLDSLGKEPAEPKRVAAFDSMAALTVSADMRFAFIQKAPAPWDGIWRLSITDGKEERIGTVPAPWMDVQSMTRDGKELLWLKWDDRAKLSLIDHPFE